MPYQPGIEYRGDQYLFQGISQAGGAVADGIKRWREESKQRKQINSTFDTVGKAMEKMVEVGAMPPGMLKQFADAQNGTVEAKAGLLTGAGEVFKMFQQTQQMAAQNKQLENEAARVRQEAERLGLLKRQQSRADAADARQQAFAAKLAEASTSTPDVTREYPSLLGESQPGVADFTGGTVTTPGRKAQALTPELVAQTAGATGTLTPEGAMQLSQLAQKVDAGRPEAMTLKLGDGSEVTGVWDRVKGFQEVEQAKKTGEPIIVSDDKGKPMFYGLPTGKGGLTWKPVSSGELMPVPGHAGTYRIGNRLFKIDAKNELLFEFTAGLGGGGEEPEPVSSGPAPIRRRFKADGTEAR